MGGASLLYRRNFVQPDARVIPYFNAGLGGLYERHLPQLNRNACGRRTVPI